MFPCISGLCAEYQSCREFHDLGAHKISASLDLCANSYGPNIVPRPAEKKTDWTERQKLHFSTILTIYLALELNTKVVVR